MPVLPLVLGSHIIEKFGVILDGVFFQRQFAAVEAHVVAVGVQQGHAAVFDDPVQFLFPDIDTRVSHDDIKEMILGQRVGHLDVAAVAPPAVADPKREDGADGVWLGLERVGVKGGGGVQNVEDVHPLQVVVHGG